MKKRRNLLPIWITLAIMFLIGFIYGFSSIRCECGTKIGCVNCSYMEAGLLSATGFLIISLIPTILGYFLVRKKMNWA